ncbi:DJ-1/PfpI family protein [Maribacter sp. LLG6340-A2]|uniref:DJ-1/PfpI family protein n=1 Tax=Maribacter sp. LLG6340-A2 TaxID=3160834 RepID=UPI003867F85C
MKFIYLFILLPILLISCNQKKDEKEKVITNEEIRTLPELNPENYNVAFLIMNGTFNTEFTAPFDIFQHTKFRKGIKAMNTFTIANTLEPITTFEGVRILPDYDYTKDELPTIDILVVPSAEHSMDSDLKDIAMINFIKQVDKNALYVTSHCDGVFPLAKAGILDAVASTTFPSDIENYKTMFPHLNIKDNVLFVHDGKYITSAGGAKSFEAALYLCQVLYGEDIAKSLAKGLVIDWDLEQVPHLIVE